MDLKLLLKQEADIIRKKEKGYRKDLKAIRQMRDREIKRMIMEMVINDKANQVPKE